MGTFIGDLGSAGEKEAEDEGASCQAAGPSTDCEVPAEAAPLAAVGDEGAPFTEAKVPYCTKAHPFADVVLDLIQEIVPAAQPPLEELHQSCRCHVLRRAFKDLGTARMKTTERKERYQKLIDLWCDFVRDVLRPHLGEEWVVFEAEPSIRVHWAQSKAPVAPHCDADHFHSPFEVNFWIPLVDVTGSESLWAESTPGAGDYHPFVAKYGEAVRFYGNQAQHFTVDNVTRRTRVSLDARLIRGRDAVRAGLPRGDLVRRRHFLTQGETRFTVFGYYGVMAADGELDADACQARGLPLFGDSASQIDSAPLLRRAAAVAEPEERRGRARSSSPEHVKKCVAELGSVKEAVKRCARCGWLASRERLSRRLVYINADGHVVPWVAEHPDPTAPWGLGCVPCAEAARMARGAGSSRSCPFAGFSFGRAVGGRQPLLVKVLLRHGNNAAGQCRDKQRIIQRNEAHQLAVEALGGSQPALGPELRDPEEGYARRRPSLGQEEPETGEDFSFDLFA